ncbi:dienelactone hydrolase family protein [Terricaulis sp.]|uniref:dienelactone hydrolase family protein n=1 Tax=Terricaulis sp. TaxID=2768686 RepID=UPI003783DB3B
MAEKITLTNKTDGFGISAHRVRASSGKAIGGVVVIQEIFGITPHIEAMSAYFADAGYDVIAPSLFDRIEANFQAGHDQEGIQKGIKGVMSSPWTQVMGDVQAAIDALPKPCYVTGFCYGGAVSWMAAAQCSGVSAVSCFYGRLIADLTQNTPKAPVMLHYGARDPSIPADNVERVRLAAPDSPLYLYDAGHGFCREGSHDYNADAAKLALTRTVDWFARWRQEEHA